MDIPLIVAVDANVLVCACEKEGDRKEKVMHLLARLDKARGRLILPTPAVAEFLVYANQAGIELLESLTRKSSVEVASFDLAAAYEASNMDAAALGRKDKRDGQSEPWQKVKVDRQNVAVAKAKGAGLIISDDDGVRAAAARVGIRAASINDLDLPDHARQANLPMPEVHEGKSKRKKG